MVGRKKIKRKIHCTFFAVLEYKWERNVLKQIEEENNFSPDLFLHDSMANKCIKEEDTDVKLFQNISETISVQNYL